MKDVPKAVVFDLGKVLVDFDYGVASRKIAAQSDFGEAGVRKLLDHAPLLFRYETGLLTRKEFYDEVCREAAYRGSFEEFGAHFADIFWEIEPMIALQATLKKAGVPTYIFSNTNDLAIEHIKRKFPFFVNFNDYIYSYEHGAMKPNARLYEVVEEKTGLTGPAIVYLDDRAENVAGGVARGWRGILHETPAKSFAALQGMGLPTPPLKSS
jgi:HAD superfamily hydrolase (TIGR01509 family)